MASRRQISGTFSISTQWICRFSRSEMSAVSRPNSVAICPSVRSAAADSAFPSLRTRIMKYGASKTSACSSPVQLPS